MQSWIEAMSISLTAIHTWPCKMGYFHHDTRENGGSMAEKVEEAEGMGQTAALSPSIFCVMSDKAQHLVVRVLLTKAQSPPLCTAVFRSIFPLINISLAFVC